MALIDARPIVAGMGGLLSRRLLASMEQADNVMCPALLSFPGKLAVPLRCFSERPLDALVRFLLHRPMQEVIQFFGRCSLHGGSSRRRPRNQSGRVGGRRPSFEAFKCSDQNSGGGRGDWSLLFQSERRQVMRPHRKSSIEENLRLRMTECSAEEAYHSEDSKASGQRLGCDKRVSRHLLCCLTQP